jgi:hypothetical protein
MQTGAIEERCLQRIENSLQVFVWAPSGNSFSYFTPEGQGAGWGVNQQKTGIFDKKYSPVGPPSRKNFSGGFALITHHMMSILSF